MVPFSLFISFTRFFMYLFIFYFSVKFDLTKKKCLNTIRNPVGGIAEQKRKPPAVTHAQTRCGVMEESKTVAGTAFYPPPPPPLTTLMVMQTNTKSVQRQQQFFKKQRSSKECIFRFQKKERIVKCARREQINK